MNDLNDLFKWWVKRHKYEIELFFNPNPPPNQKEYYQPFTESNFDDILLDIIDDPKEMGLENSGILEAMISIDFFTFFEKFKEHCRPMYKKWKEEKSHGGI